MPCHAMPQKKTPCLHHIDPSKQSDLTQATLKHASRGSQIGRRKATHCARSRKPRLRKYQELITSLLIDGPNKSATSAATLKTPSSNGCCRIPVFPKNLPRCRRRRWSWYRRRRIRNRLDLQPRPARRGRLWWQLLRHDATTAIPIAIVNV